MSDIIQQPQTDILKLRQINPGGLAWMGSQQAVPLSAQAANSRIGAKVRPDHRPLYIRAEEALRELLESGAYRPGEQLPTEPDLAQQFGISRSTLREAMRTFEEQGWISRRHGVGTFVNQPPAPLIDSGLETLESIDRLARRRGLVIHTRGLTFETQAATQELAAILRAPEGAPLTVVTSAKVAASRPVAYMVDFLSAAIVSHETMQERFGGSVLDYLQEHTTQEIAYARADIVPAAANELLAARLEIAPGDLLLLLEQTLYGADDQVIEFSRNYFVPEFFRFHVNRRVERRPLASIRTQYGTIRGSLPTP